MRISWTAFVLAVLTALGTGALLEGLRVRLNQQADTAVDLTSCKDVKIQRINGGEIAVLVDLRRK